MDNLKLEDIGQGISKVLSNGTALIKEAELLFQANRFPRAYALAHLACEELAKLPMLNSGGLAIFNGDRFDWGAFKKRFKDHRAKQFGHSFLQACIEQKFENGPNVEKFLRELPVAVKDLNENKNKSIYVDLSDGTFSAPDDVISSDMAKGMIAKARRCGVLFAGFQLLMLKRIGIEIAFDQWNELLREELFATAPESST